MHIEKLKIYSKKISSAKRIIALKINALSRGHLQGEVPLTKYLSQCEITIKQK